MRRVPTWLAATSLVLAAVTGCGGQTRPATSPAAPSSSDGHTLATPGRWALDRGLCGRLRLPALLRPAHTSYDVTPKRAGHPVIAEYHRQHSGGDRATARCTLKTPGVRLQILFTTSENDDVLTAEYTVEQLSHAVSHYHGPQGYYRQSITTPSPRGAWWSKRKDAVYDVLFAHADGSRTLHSTLATTVRSGDLVVYIGVRARTATRDRAADRSASGSLSAAVDRLVAALPHAVRSGSARVTPGR